MEEIDEVDPSWRVDGGNKRNSNSGNSFCIFTSNEVDEVDPSSPLNGGNKTDSNSGNSICVSTADETDEIDPSLTVSGGNTPSNGGNSIRIFTSDTLEWIDRQDVALAYRYRVSLRSKPRQSSFRVLALIFYEIPSTENEDERSLVPGMPTFAPWIAQTSQDGRSFVVGTNDEGGFIGGAICAERAAMVQFRFLPNFSVTKVVISTDSEDPITPGLLCREFLAGHPTVPWNTPVISVGCKCVNSQKKDEALLFQNGSSQSTSGECLDEGPTMALPTILTTLKELYPFPSPYTRLTANQSTMLGEKYSARASDHFETLVEADSKRLLELAILEARSNVSDLHPIQFGAAAIFDDGTIIMTRQSSALEYGCTLDAVSQLAPHFQDQNGTPLLLVQADQYGIAHAPFAPARAFLIEHGFANCQIVLHDAPVSDNDDDIFDIEKWTLKEVFVSELVPTPPAWTKGTVRE